MPPLDEDEQVAYIIAAEAVGDGPDGMEMVRDSMHNRRKSGQSMYQVAMAPKQYSASARKDLAKFFSRQPTIYQNLARELVKETYGKDYTPKYTIKNYVTKDLYDRRHAPDVPSWIRNMDPAGLVGHHVLLQEKKKVKAPKTP